LSKDLFDFLKIEKEVVNLDKDVLIPLLKTERVYAYKTPEYMKDMGTPDRFAAVSKDVAEGKPARRNLSNKQRAVFLDRDGTLNKDNGFVTKSEQFELVDDAAHEVRLINEAGLLAIVITNQPVIARGDCTFDELELIHNKMETELGKEGAFLDDIYFCPHHLDKGFAGERPEYKIDCDCRKPKPGMFFEAAKKYNIDLAKSFMIGDTENDEKAGKAAGCTSVLLDGISLTEAVTKCLQTR
jgi:D,D-heptose 1,7-bisphosphate phosphatase